jgi:hypothetical protein
VAKKTKKPKEKPILEGASPYGGKPPQKLLRYLLRFLRQILRPLTGIAMFS